ncbi:P-loop containing nucleoside triphosphate hydrolase protein [Melanogaster broomeanus]|nr:P-loop containing nucleoside triphosphate hydrolase protein [Melanogaster broomeanus]
MPGPSGKQRKAQLQLKRAIKRGDAPKPAPLPASKRKKLRRSPKPGHTLEARQASDEAAKAARKLQSAFVNLDRAFLEDTRRLAGSIALKRPIPGGVSVLNDGWLRPMPKVAAGDGDTELGHLSVPKRPKWKYTMTKEEVDANEQGHFRKWLSQQDTIIERWQSALNQQVPQSRDADQSIPSADAASLMPYPPTHFERNLEVWRQLWRVTEISQILLVLLDSRCPPLHLPPAPRIILVLTKVDISGPARTASWTSYLNAHYPGVPVVPVEAYAPKSAASTSESNAQGRTRYEPSLPGTFRERLIGAMREVHAQMLQPPEWVTALRAGETEEERTQRMARWRPRVRREVDWEGVLRPRGKMVGRAIGGAAVPMGTEDDRNDDADERAADTQEWNEPEFLTIGLIGQPNVGKSSLLNAVFGMTRVRASRTPGKTKHFQTLFWTSDVRLVDCPGLVMPSFVPMDIQVLSGVLPISRIAAIPFCVHQLARLLPLERILGLTHPSTSKTTSTEATSTPATHVEDKRTWRPGQRLFGQTRTQSDEPKWTANDIMTAYAEKKGWVTAKAGRPDVHRAGNAILRLVAEGKIPWAFWPSGTPSSVIDTSSDGDGIWLKNGVEQHGWDELQIDDSDGDGEEEATSDSSDVDEMEDEEECEEKTKPVTRGRGSLGRFGALSIDDD